MKRTNGFISVGGVGGLVEIDADEGSKFEAGSAPAFGEGFTLSCFAVTVLHNKLLKKGQHKKRHRPKYTRFRRPLHAFTLIELLVVIAIIALLTAIIAPSLRKAKYQVQVAICASNQRQCITGVLAYSVDNDFKLPPDISKRYDIVIPNSWANCLNYHPGAPAADNSGAMFTYLGPYLAEVHVFMCPVAPGVKTEEVQELYENPTQIGGGTTLVSYNMYWGGYTVPEGTPGLPREFVGPTGTEARHNSAGLMICDVMSFWGRQELWWLSHRPERRDVEKLKYDPIYGSNIEMLWTVWGSIDEVPKRIKMNAGYVDGHVERYTEEETIAYQQVMHLFYIPQKWR